MRRDIDFLAWDSKDKKFLNPDSLVMRLNGCVFDREKDEELHHIELLQYIEKNDKNGKRIYDGHIIYDPKSQFLGEIKYENGDLKIEVFNWGGAQFREIDIEKTAIIGHKYDSEISEEEE